MNMDHPPGNADDPDDRTSRNISDSIADRFLAEMAEVYDSNTETVIGPCVPFKQIRPTPLPERLGSYRILREVGHGGMGVVYEAEQDHPQRRVALKVISPHLVSTDLLRRFAMEAELLGRLQHPGIAVIHQAGTFETHRGMQPFFAMELIDGSPLTNFVQTNRCSTRERAELLVRICEAVQHAHSRGVIHRDLKPANILVDGTGQPKVLDFGVARATDADVRSTTLRTDVGQIIGTLHYMSPEQAGGDPDEIDTRSDVYALGVIAYELLTDRIPYDLSGRKIHEAIRFIREETPPPISFINRTLRGDLEVIVATAMAKEPSRRYPTASAFAADLQRYLRSEPILAREPSTWYQLLRFTRRHRPLVVGVAATLLMLITGVIATSVALQRALAAERESKERLEHVERMLRFQVARVADIDPEAISRIIRQRVVPDDSLDAPGLHRLQLPDFTDIAHEIVEQEIIRASHLAIFREVTDEMVQAELLQTLATAARLMGMIDVALDIQLEAAEIFRRLVGGDAPQMLSALNGLATIQYVNGDLIESQRIFRSVLERSDVSDRTRIRPHLEALLSLASLHAARDEQDIADGMLTSALPIAVAAWGEDDPFVQQMTGALALIRMELGRFEEADVLFRRAFVDNADLSPQDRYGIASTLINHAELVREQGDLEKSAHLYEQVREFCRRYFGAGHILRLQAENNLGVVLLDLGRLDEALTLLRGVYETGRERFGPEHPEVIAFTGVYAASLISARRFDEGIALLQEQLRVRRGDPQTPISRLVHTLGILGDAFRSAGELDQAEETLREAMELVHHHGPKTVPSGWQTLHLYGRVLVELERFAEALPLQLAAIEWGEEVVPEHPFVGILHGSMFRILLGLNRREEAVRHAERAHGILLASLGPHHAATIDIVRRMVAFLEDLQSEESDDDRNTEITRWRAHLVN